MLEHQGLYKAFYWLFWDFFVWNRQSFDFFHNFWLYSFAWKVYTWGYFDFYKVKVLVVLFICYLKLIRSKFMQLKDFVDLWSLCFPGCLCQDSFCNYFISLSVWEWIDPIQSDFLIVFCFFVDSQSLTLTLIIFYAQSSLLRNLNVFLHQGRHH